MAARTWRGLVSRRLLDSDGSLGGGKQPLVAHREGVGMVILHFLLSFVLSFMADASAGSNSQ